MEEMGADYVMKVGKLMRMMSEEEIAKIINEKDLQWRKEHSIDNEEIIIERYEPVELSKEYLSFIAHTLYIAQKERTER